MDNPFSLPRVLVYTERRRSDFDTKNPASLDCLLKQMYLAECKEAHPSINLETALNTAYYIAVCLANTDYPDEFEWSSRVMATIENAWKSTRPRQEQCPYAPNMLIQWMVYAILYLQEVKSEEMNSFLSMFRQRMENDRFVSLFGHIDDQSCFLSSFPKLVDEWPHRYSGNLYLRPASPQQLAKGNWSFLGCGLDVPKLEQWLRLYPTIQEQQAFLDWVKKAEAEWGEPDLPLPDLPF